MESGSLHDCTAIYTFASATSEPFTSEKRSISPERWSLSTASEGMILFVRLTQGGCDLVGCNMPCLADSLRTHGMPLSACQQRPVAQ